MELWRNSANFLHNLLVLLAAEAENDLAKELLEEGAGEVLLYAHELEELDRGQAG